MSSDIDSKYLLYLLKQFANPSKGFTLIELLVAIAIAGILAAIFIPVFFVCGARPARQSIAKVFIIQLNRSQQNFYLENQKFANAIAHLKIEMSSKTAQNYTYSIQTTPQSTFQFAVPNTYAIREEEFLFVKREIREPSSLTGFVGAVFVIPKTKIKDSEMVSIICRGDNHSESPLPLPILKDNKPVCANGTNSI